MDIIRVFEDGKEVVLVETPEEQAREKLVEMLRSKMDAKSLITGSLLIAKEGVTHNFTVTSEQIDLSTTTNLFSINLSYNNRGEEKKSIALKSGTSLTEKDIRRGPYFQSLKRTLATMRELMV